MEKKTGQHSQPHTDVIRMLEAAAGHVFANPELAELALTHSSYANDTGKEGRHNERLEFLGDAVLGLCVSSHLFRCFPKAREGELTVMYDELVCEKTLARLARKFELDKAMLLGKGEEMQGGRARDSLLADAFEAWLAAIYLDGGLSGAEAFVARAYAELWPATPPDHLKYKDPKTLLQEICLKNYGELPVYTLACKEGADHDRIFSVRLVLPDGSEFLGREKSIKKAGQAAAASALQKILPGGSPLAGRPSMAQ